MLDGLIIENIGSNSKGIWIHGTDNAWLCIMNWIRARKIRGAGTTPPMGSIGVEISSDTGIAANTNNIVDVGYLKNLDTGIKLGGNNNEIHGIVEGNNTGVDITEGKHIIIIHEEANTNGIIVRDAAKATIIPRYVEKINVEGTGKAVLVASDTIVFRSQYPEKTPVLSFLQEGNYNLQIRGHGTSISLFDPQTNSDLIWFTNDGRILATGGLQTKVDVGDFGGGFANYTPSPSVEGAIIIAIDTNAVSPGKRLYVYANGAWHYVDLV